VRRGKAFARASIEEEKALTMKTADLLGVALAVIFTVLSLLHVGWAFGARIASGSVVPEVDGRPAFQPSRILTLAVAGLLALAAWVVLVRAGWVLREFPQRLATVGCATLGAILVLRGIGEFRLVGLFKSVRGTAFARWDSWLYSPLALTLGLAALWLATRPRTP
jgi:hypothetical protein